MKNIRYSLGDRNLAGLLGLLALLVGCSADNNEGAPSSGSTNEGALRAPPQPGAAMPGTRGHAPPPRHHGPPPHHPSCGSGGSNSNGPGNGNAGNGSNTDS